MWRRYVNMVVYVVYEMTYADWHTGTYEDVSIYGAFKNRKRAVKEAKKRMKDNLKGGLFIANDISNKANPFKKNDYADFYRDEENEAKGCDHAPPCPSAGLVRREHLYHGCADRRFLRRLPHAGGKDPHRQGLRPAESFQPAGRHADDPHRLHGAGRGAHHHRHGRKLCTKDQSRPHHGCCLGRADLVDRLCRYRADGAGRHIHGTGTRRRDDPRRCRLERQRLRQGDGRFLFPL